MQPEDALRAAIVCVHVAEGAPILLARRDPPDRPEDSGWQFVCNNVDIERPAEAQVWALKNVVKNDVVLSSMVEEPPGTVLTRRSQYAPWKVMRVENEDAE